MMPYLFKLYILYYVVIFINVDLKQTYKISIYETSFLLKIHYRNKFELVQRLENNWFIKWLSD